MSEPADTPPTPSDERLLDRYRRGEDHDALVVLWNRHEPALRARACLTIGRADPDGVADVLQEAFLKVMKSASSFRGEGSVAGWLEGVVRNEARLRARTASRRDRHEREAGAREPSAAAPTAADAAFRHEVIACVEGLQPDQRDVVVLRFMGGLSYTDLARELGIPVGTVGSRLHAALANLRTRLDVTMLATGIGLEVMLERALGASAATPTAAVPTAAAAATAGAVAKASAGATAGASAAALASTGSAKLIAAAIVVTASVAAGAVLVATSGDGPAGAGDVALAGGDGPATSPDAPGGGSGGGANPAPGGGDDTDPGRGDAVAPGAADGPVSDDDGDERAAAGETGETATDADLALARRLATARMTVNFQLTPFDEALGFIHDIAGLPYAATKAAREAMTANDVSMRTADTSLGEILTAMMKPAGLSWEVRHGLVWFRRADETLSDRIDLTRASKGLLGAIDREVDVASPDGSVKLGDAIRALGADAHLIVAPDPALDLDARLLLQGKKITRRAALEAIAAATGARITADGDRVQIAPGK